MGVAVPRERDMLLGGMDLEEICVFGNFPVYMGTTEQDAGEDLFEDMQWMISGHSGMVQLGKVIPDKILYKISHNTGYGKTWQEHYHEFSEFLFKHTSASGGGTWK